MKNHSATYFTDVLLFTVTCACSMCSDVAVVMLVRPAPAVMPCLLSVVSVLDLEATGYILHMSVPFYSLQIMSLLSFSSSICIVFVFQSFCIC